MTTVTIEEAQSHLAEIINELAPGDEVVLTRENKPVATIRAAPATALSPREPPKLGTLKGTILNIAPDFDDIPEGFEDCLP
jgi:antitoxin (DNA-binding transcriptional repressor) of toxin-antitoxin stability system